MTDFSQSNLFLASRWRRLLATAFDAILVPVVTIFLVMVFGVVEHAEDFVDRWWMVHVLIIAIGTYLLLNGYTLWHSGQTLGKKIMSIAIVMRQPLPDGDYAFLPSPFWKLIVRALFFPVLFVGIIPFLVWLPILDLVSIFGKQRRCLHDYVCDTMVVKLN